jgi:acetylornithine deacetylase/succinyl-diaminopimelate desuccinylase-like protein
MTQESILSHLMSFRATTEAPLQTKALLQWYAAQVRNQPVETVWFEQNGFTSLLITTKKTKTPRLWLAAHIDVVPGPDDLFTITHSGGNLVGRGVFDMQFAAASYLVILNELTEKLPTLDFGIMLTSDEEIGGKNGVGALVREGYLATCVVLPDGGPNWELITVGKGVLHLKIIATGRSAHGSRPWLGENAIEQLLAIYTRFDSFCTQQFGAPSLTTTSWALTTINGGTATNQIPDAASLTIDVRPATEVDRETILQYLHDHTISYETLSDGACLSLSEDLPELSAIKNSASQNNITLTQGAMCGSFDGRYFAAENIPVLCFQPPGGDIHSTAEWIDSRGWEIFTKIIKDFVCEYAQTEIT